MSFERLEPDTPEWTAYVANHEHRYAFAAARLAHLRQPACVLDAATGVGYGAAYLADRCGVRIVAVDRDARAVHLARAHFHRPLVEYLEDDCTTLTQAADGRGPYDAVVSFETIEHLADPAPFLRRAASLLTPHGLLIASTPNGTADGGHAWDYHEREYTAPEFEALLDAAGFRSVRLFGQRLTAIGQLRRDVRGEINRLRFNPFARAGFWLQRRLRGFTPGPALPEQANDFEIVPFASADECERQGAEGPFVLIAVATT
jgi:2-polyprenyl-3-methyl-5-hydroxy-6-metoxy-1,4-benzoquinol methylase